MMDFILAADAAENSTGIIGSMVGAIGGVGFAVWFGYHVTTRTLPQMARQFTETMDRICDRHDQNMRTFWNEKREDRRDDRAAILQLAAEIKRANEEFREVIRPRGPEKDK